MPEINESTPREPITIAGETFNAPRPYAEGHRLNAHEAAALNQTFVENLRNNFASTVKAAKEAGNFDQEVFQGQLDDVADEYEFGSRRGGGGRTSDPVQAEAMSIARDAVRRKIKSLGKNLSDYSAREISDHARRAIEANPQIVERARATVEARKAEGDLGAGIEIGEPAPAEKGETEAAPKGGRKPKAETPTE